MARKIGSNGAETAARVRAAALELFAQSGYAAVSMRAIASRIGVQAGALYNHFPTKQDLLRDILSEHMETLIASWEDVRDERLPPAEALEQFVRFHVRYHLDRSSEIFISYMELRSLEAENLGAITKLRDRYEQFLNSILARGKARGDFRIDDIRLSALAIIAMLTGIITWYKPGGRLSLDEIEDIYVALVARSVGQEEERIACSQAV